MRSQDRVHSLVTATELTADPMRLTLNGIESTILEWQTPQLRIRTGREVNECGDWVVWPAAGPLIEGVATEFTTTDMERVFMLV